MNTPVGSGISSELTEAARGRETVGVSRPVLDGFVRIRGAVEASVNDDRIEWLVIIDIVEARGLDIDLGPFGQEYSPPGDISAEARPVGSRTSSELTNGLGRRVRN